MKEIKLNNSILFALVDDIDEENINKYEWNINHAGYAVKCLIQRGVPSIMHRIILGLPLHKGIVDHIDRNKLNNQRSNLRIVSHADNLRNSKIGNYNGKTSKYKGVNWERRDKRWTSIISMNTIGIRLITTSFEEEAAYAYDCATQYLGQLAYKNSVDTLLNDEQKSMIKNQVVERLERKRRFWMHS